ncbi:MAG: UDP-glucose 4-epimerase [Firmicutes bacterium ADurb.Bin456]|nr:MAG: UDP-glucose 4-epimerase [Firmicutes bacterium ADurb.Bin456]
MFKKQLASSPGNVPVSLVTGASGFLGSHLVDRLLLKGHRVLGLDNLSTGNLENLGQALSNGRTFFFIQADVAEDFSLPGTKLNYIWHLASPASPVDYRSLNVETMLANSIGTKKMLDLALQHQARFLLASTSEAYGDPLIHPQPETYWGNVNPVGERSCYDESKRFAETLTFEYRRRYGLDTRIVRIFNTYGPRMQVNDGRAGPNFICQALRGEPLTLYGSGSQTRSFIFVTDEIEGILRAMFYENTCGEVINIGNPQECTILEFAGIIARLCGVKCSLVYRPLPPDDPARRCPDISKARALLGWQPRVPLERGLAMTINYFRKKLNLQ